MTMIDTLQTWQGIISMEYLLVMNINEHATIGVRKEKITYIKLTKMSKRKCLNVQLALLSSKNTKKIMIL